MNNSKQLRTGIVVFLLFVLGAFAPVIALVYVSSAEQMQYLPAEIIEAEDYSYGEICEVKRRDFNERIVRDGIVKSIRYDFLELGQYEDASFIRLIISEEQVIQEGDTIGYYKGEPIQTNKTGVVKNISISTDSYILLESIAAEDLVLEMQLVGENEISIVQLPENTFRDIEGRTFSKKTLSPYKNADGTVTVQFYCINGTLTYGAEIKDMVLLSKSCLKDVLSVDCRCVYSYANTKGYYIRIVDNNGKFLEEREVTIGQSDESYICVSGVEEGVLCDSGYKAVVEGQIDEY